MHEEERLQRWRTRVVDDLHPQCPNPLSGRSTAISTRISQARHDLADPVLDLRGTFHRLQQCPTVDLSQVGPSRCASVAAWPRRFGWSCCQAHASGRAPRYPGCRSLFARLRRTRPRAGSSSMKDRLCCRRDTPGTAPVRPTTAPSHHNQPLHRNAGRRSRQATSTSPGSPDTFRRQRARLASRRGTLDNAFRRSGEKSCTVRFHCTQMEKTFFENIHDGSSVCLRKL